MNPLDLIPKPLLAALIAVLAATSFKLHWDKNGLVIDIEKGKTKIAQLEGAYNRDVAAATKKALMAEKQVRKTEQAWQLAMDEERKKTDEQVALITAERDAMRVRYMPRAVAAAARSLTFGGTTFDAASIEKAPFVYNRTELPDELGQQIEEATRADTIRVELLNCYKAYDNLVPTKPE